MTAPDLRTRLDDLLRRCVQCGLCLPHCATYTATGDETRSPRGRLLLLPDALDGDDADGTVTDTFDTCLGCRACVTACPSGVAPDLLEAGRAVARDGRDLPRVLGLSVGPERLPLLASLGHVAERAMAVLGGSSWRGRSEGSPLAGVARLLGSRPVALRADLDLVKLLDGLTGVRTRPGAAHPARAAERTVALFAGCANRGMLSDTQRRLVGLLAACGVAVETPPDQTCCGALEEHAGRTAAAAGRRRRNTAALGDAVTTHDSLLVEAAGCGLALEEQGGFPDGAVVDAAVLLDGLALPPRRSVPLTVAYHDPCHALHGRGIHAEPRRLLQGIPDLRLVEPEGADLCCGGAGGYALDHPDLSREMGRRKARALLEAGADLVVTSNPGCLGQIRDGLLLEDPSVPILPLTDLLWYASLS